MKFKGLIRSEWSRSVFQGHAVHLRSQQTGVDLRLAAAEVHVLVKLGELVEGFSMEGAVEAVTGEETEEFERLDFWLCNCLWVREAPGAFHKAESASSLQPHLD